MNKKSEIIQFLVDELTQLEYIVEAHIIGSFVDSKTYNDIDVIILFKVQRNLTEVINGINKLKSSFKKKFTKSLHVSSFTFRESAHFNSFKTNNSLLNL